MARRGGPATRQGKARSSVNALTHAITSNDPVIPEYEDQGEYDAHLQGFIQYFQPEGAVESFLVERYASVFWRLRRIARHEVHRTIENILSVPDHLALTANYLSGTKEYIEPDPDVVAARAHNTVLPTAADMERIARYESHLTRQVIQTLRQLLVLQARRTGKPPYLGPVDFRGPATA